MRWHESAQLFCQTVQHGGSLSMVMKMKANWARLLVAIFTMAMFYASVCSANCAAGPCPEQTRRTAGRDCDQMPSHHSGPSGHQTPDRPECSLHQHPELFAAKSGSDLLRFRLSIADHRNASAAAFPPVHGLSAVFTRDVSSEHAPPPASAVRLYDRISVLRI